MYELDIRGWRPSIALEKLMRSMLLLVPFSTRNERPLVKRTGYTLLFHWFVGLSLDDAAWNQSRCSASTATG